MNRLCMLGGLLIGHLVPAIAADPKCKAAMQREMQQFMETRIPLSPHLGRRFIEQLRIFYPKGLPPETTYFLGTIYNVFADRAGLPLLPVRGSALAGIERLNYDQQLSFYTLLRHHPLLTSEVAPNGRHALFTDFAPHWLPGEQRDTLNEILSGFYLPNYLGSFVAVSPLRPADLIGEMTVHFFSGNRFWNFRVNFIDEASYSLEQNGQILADGSWRLTDGVVYLDGEARYEFHLEDATLFALRKRYVQLMRIQAGRALGIMSVHLLPGRNEP